MIRVIETLFFYTAEHKWHIACKTFQVGGLAILLYQEVPASHSFNACLNITMLISNSDSEFKTIKKIVVFDLINPE